MSTTSKTLYLPLSIVTSVTGGLLAGAIFTQVCKRFSGSDPEDPAPPDPTDLSTSARSALLGAGLQGLIFGAVKAAADRAGARGYRAVTHENPA